MPDRYGEYDPNPGYPQADPATEPAQSPDFTRRLIASCDLCDDHGVRHGFACDHTDWAPIARRGIAQVRAALKAAKENR